MGWLGSSLKTQGVSGVPFKIKIHVKVQKTGLSAPVSS